MPLSPHAMTRSLGSPATGEVVEVSLPLVTPELTRGLNVDNRSARGRKRQINVMKLKVDFKNR